MLMASRRGKFIGLIFVFGVMLGAASLVLLLQSEAGRGYGRPDVVMAVSDRLGSRKHEYHVAEGCDCRYTVQPFLRSRESFDGADVVLLPLYHDDSLANFSLHLAPHQLLVPLMTEPPTVFPQIHDYNIAAQFNFTASWALPSDTNVMASFGPIPFRNPRIERVLESWDDLEHLPPLKEKNAPFDAAYLASHMGRVNRDDLASQLNLSYISVGFYGKRLHNADLAKNEYRYSTAGALEKIDLIATHLFTLAFENSVCEGYVTEKLWQALYAGSVPVYLGSKTLVTPEHSVIHVKDFTSLDHLGKYLQLLKRNSTLYEEYHAWRNQPFVGEFASLVEAQKMEGTDLLCSICRKAKEWNQTHTHPKVPPFQGCIKKFHKLFREP